MEHIRKGCLAVGFGYLSLVVASVFAGILFGSFDELLHWLLPQIELVTIREWLVYVVGTVCLIVAFTVTALLTERNILLNVLTLCFINIAVGLYLNASIYTDDPTPTWYFLWSLVVAGITAIYWINTKTSSPCAFK